MRAEEEQDNPPLGRLLGHLEHDDLLTTIALGPLDQAATAQLAGEVAEQPLDEAALARTFRETEGHPLFIVERGRMELARQPGASGDDELPRVQSVVAARLALLSEEARAAAEVAAAVGRDFRFDILAQASDLEEDALVRALDELWRRHIVRVQADERWDFSHDRIREVAYGGIGPARRRLIHRRIAQGMELLFADRLDEVSASIAVHLDRGGQPARAVPFLERAAAVATRVSANEEAIRCLTHALSLLERLPAARDRDERELALRSSLSVALNSARGYAAPEVEQNLDRVFTLSRADGTGRGARALAVGGVHAPLHARRLEGHARGLGAGARAQRLRSVVPLRGASRDGRHAVEHRRARRLARPFEAALAAYDERHPQRSALGSDLGVFAHAWYSHALWLLGEEDAAVAHVEQAVALARRLDHLYSQTLALAYAALLHQMRRDSGRVLECAEAVVALCERYGFAYYGDWAQVLIGWARGQERPAEGSRDDRVGARAPRRTARAGAPAVLPVAARRDVQPARAIGIARPRFWMRQSPWRSSDGDVWWLPALYLQKSELEPAGRARSHASPGARAAPAHNSRAWSGGFSRPRCQQRPDAERLADPPETAARAGTLSRTFLERSAS